jgi:hypothetical protein
MQSVLDVLQAFVKVAAVRTVGPVSVVLLGVVQLTEYLKRLRELEPEPPAFGPRK